MKVVAFNGSSRKDGNTASLIWMVFKELAAEDIDVEISYTRQSEPKGLGHAVWCARDLVGDEPFAVLICPNFVGLFFT